MKINTIKIKWAENELSQNTHLIEFENTCVLVDAGCNVEQIKSLTDKPIKAILITHGHFDHIKDIEEYDRHDIPIYAHRTITEMLTDEYMNVSKFFNQPKIYNIDNIQFVDDNQILKIDGHVIKCIYTPGHSIDGMCYLVDDEYLFSGDTVFSVAVGRDDLPTASTNQLINSLKRVLDLDYKYLYTGHGRPSSKEEQKQNIPKWIKALNNKG